VSPFWLLTSCTPLKSSLYLGAALSDPDQTVSLHFIYQMPFKSLFHCLGRTNVSVQVRCMSCFVTMPVFTVRSCQHLPKPKLEDHPLSLVCDCLINIFAVTLHIGDRSSIRNLRTRQAVVTGTHLSRNQKYNNF